MTVFSDDYEWWIAKDKDDLKKLICEEEKIHSPEHFEEFNYYECKPEDKFTLILSDRYDVPEDEWEEETKTFGEWEKEKARGFLGGTEY